jgi:nucleotide-binding universal stress UspA family protein
LFSSVFSLRNLYDEGVHQIGEVYARSWWVVFASSGKEQEKQPPFLPFLARRLSLCPTESSSPCAFSSSTANLWRDQVSDAIQELERAQHQLAPTVRHRFAQDVDQRVRRSPRGCFEVAERQNSDVVVMGTLSRTGLKGLLLGNTSETVLQGIDATVVAIKPEGIVSPVKFDT